MMNRASQMPRRIRNIREQFYRAFKGIRVEQNRVITCANYVNNNMGFAVSKLYIKKYFDDNARNQSKEIMNNIRNSIITILEQVTWMDMITKTKAIDKVIELIQIKSINSLLQVKSIYENIGYPDYIASDNVTQLEDMYIEVRILFIFPIFTLSLFYTVYL